MTALIIYCALHAWVHAQETFTLIAFYFNKLVYRTEGYLIPLHVKP